MRKTPFISALLMLAILPVRNSVLSCSDGDFNLEALTSRQAFHDFEIIPLRLRLTNTSDRIIFLTEDVKGGWGFRVSIAGPGQDFAEALIHRSPKRV